MVPKYRFLKAQGTVYLIVLFEKGSEWWCVEYAYDDLSHWKVVDTTSVERFQTEEPLTEEEFLTICNASSMTGHQIRQEALQEGIPDVPKSSFTEGWYWEDL